MSDLQVASDTPLLVCGPRNYMAVIRLGHASTEAAHTPLEVLLAAPGIMAIYGASHVLPRISCRTGVLAPASSWKSRQQQAFYSPDNERVDTMHNLVENETIYGRVSIIKTKCTAQYREYGRSGVASGGGGGTGSDTSLSVGTGEERA